MALERRTASVLELISESVRAALMETHTALPARIESYDSARQVATVVVETQRQIEREDGSFDAVTIPPIPDVPVLFPRAGNVAITFPVTSGDTCLLVFAERDLSGWLQLGQEGVPPSARRHAYGDAVAILGLVPAGDAISPAPSSSAVDIRTLDGTTSIQLSSAGVTIQSTAPIQLDSDGILDLAGLGPATLAGSLLTLQATTGALAISSLVGPLTLSSVGAVSITRGANELLTILSDALDQIATSTAGADPLSNAAQITAAKNLIDAMRTP